MGFADDEGISNPTGGACFGDLVAARFARRRLLTGSAVTAAAFLAGPLTAKAGAQSGETVTGGTGGTAAAADAGGFTPVAMTAADAVTVPAGFVTQTLARWGDPINGSSPAWTPDGSNSAADQELQLGMHNDGMHYFPLSVARANDEGLLVMNHEYTDDGLLHVGGMQPWTAAKVAKSQAAHGVSVPHIRRDAGAWSIVDSHYARRITVNTPVTFSGPAAGHALLKSAGNPSGADGLGTLNNCANGATPWATYLTCEENFNGYFSNAAATVPADQRRYGVTKEGFGYRWHEFDSRFDANANPNEVNNFGWVVEINPWLADSKPVKRTALGRIKHEGAFVTESVDGHAVVYTGDDERFEYLYKYVSARPWQAMLAAGQSPLDEGTLHVAVFAADGTGTWKPLVHGQGGLTPENGFADQAEVLIKTRQAADKLGATKMDRPEWVTQNPITRELYCALTNNSQRGTEGRAPTDAANPRARNVYGHIIRWHEEDFDPASVSFTWDIFLLGAEKTDSQDLFGSPDGLWFDGSGRLWIQTDVSTSTLGQGDYANLPNNQMLVANPWTGETRRFLVGPKGCEVTGIAITPDMTTLFVNFQHPGEPASERSDPANPTAVSSWPDGSGQPRSSTVAITRSSGLPV